MKPESKAALVRDLGRRFKALIWLKSFGIPAFMAAFFLGYFLILNFPCFGVTVMPLTALDRFISYQPGAWLLYVSLWLYVQLPPGLIDDRRELVRYGWAAAGVSLVGFAIFMLWPTAVPAAAVDMAGARPEYIRNIDTTGNSCPSLHVAFAVFTAVWIEQRLRRAGMSAVLRFLNVAWCVGIVYSTLATKQHVLLDAVAGAALGFAGAAALARLENRCRARAVLPDLAQISPAARKL